MIDTHCHFDFAPFKDDPAFWLAQTQDAGVKTMLIPAVNMLDLPKIVHLSNTYSGLYYAAGLHPRWIETHQDKDLLTLEAHLKGKHKKCVALGEIGLDFAMQNPDKEKQYRFLIAQLELAQQYDLPVILHCRKAQNELIQVLNAFSNVRGVLHGFSGSKQMGLAFIQRGLLLGIGGTITYLRANKTRQAVAEFPPSTLVLETDAPDMPLCGFQGEANTPARLRLIVSTLADLTGLSEQNIIQITSKNAQACFAFPEN